MKKEIDFNKANLRIVDGKLKSIDGTSVSQRLKHFAKEGSLDENVPIRLMTDEWYRILLNLRQFVRCGFCGRHIDEVKTLIQGQKLFICNDCVEICVDIINEHRKQTSRQNLSPKPQK